MSSKNSALCVPPTLCPVPIWHCTMMTMPPLYAGMACVTYVNDTFQIYGGFSDMHMYSRLDNLGSFTGAFESEDLNPLICMVLLGFLGQVRMKTFSTITLAAYRKRVNPFLIPILLMPDRSQLTKDYCSGHSGFLSPSAFVCVQDPSLN